MILTLKYPKIIILALNKPMYSAQIRKIIAKTDLSHVCSNIALLKKDGIIEHVETKDKLKKFVKLTKKGIELRELLIKIGEFEK